MIKNILNVKWKGNKKNYQMNDYLRKEEYLCKRLSAIARRKKKKDPDKYVENKSCLQRSVCPRVCVYLNTFKEVNLTL